MNFILNQIEHGVNLVELVNCLFIIISLSRKGLAKLSDRLHMTLIVMIEPLNSEIKNKNKNTYHGKTYLSITDPTYFRYLYKANTRFIARLEI